MRIILSELAKKEKTKNRKKVKRYWNLLCPKSYSNALVASYEVGITKLANSALKKEDLVGKLRQSDTGLVYIDISNNFIHGFFPLINDEEVEKPPYFGKEEIGAHISAISDDEIEDDIKIEEIGEEIPFSIKGVYSTKPEGWDGMKRVWFVAVSCPRLKEIRRKYDLPDTYKDKGHDFHITVGVKKK